MVYDTESDRIILFGGVDATYLGATSTCWAYDFNTDTWTEQAPGPSAQQGIRMAYDVESDRVILFGGEAYTGGGATLKETWAYDYNTDSWTEMKPSTSPPDEWCQAITYDAKSDRVLMWWGSPDKSVWAYDFNTNTWTENEPAEHPPATGRFGALVYDSESDRSILYGGGDWQGGNTTDETWAYDYNTNSHGLQSHPRCSGSVWRQSWCWQYLLSGDMDLRFQLRHLDEYDVGPRVGLYAGSERMPGSDTQYTSFCR
jgi:hypothetical protein